MPEAAAVASSRVNAPKQARSQATFDRFLDAVESLLAERDYAEITVADIVARAGRTVGSFYTRFCDKDAALLAVCQRRWARDRRYLQDFLAPERWADRPLEDVVRAGYELLVELYRNPPPLLRAALLKATDDPEFSAHRSVIFDEMVELAQRIILARRAEIAHPDPAHALLLGLRHATAVCDHLLLFGAYWQADDVPHEVIVDDLVDVQMRLLMAKVCPGE